MISDLQVLPGCTLKEVLKKTSSCFVGLFSGYPYENTLMCR